MIIIILFILGLSVGSFLNVVIDRIPEGESVIHGRSHCDHCKKTLEWYDLVPLLSFVYLCGKCRYCRHSLSFQYPFVELITGISFAFTAFNYSFDILNLHEFFQGLYILIFISCMIAIFFTDLKYRIIPDEVLAILLICTFINLFIFGQNQILPGIWSALSSFAFFILLVLITRGRGMGIGDVKYAFVMGMFLGPVKTVIGLYTAFLTGGLISIILLLIKVKKMKSSIPFGPFLVMGTVIAYFWGDYLWMVISKMMGS